MATASFWIPQKPRVRKVNKPKVLQWGHDGRQCEHSSFPSIHRLHYEILSSQSATIVPTAMCGSAKCNLLEFLFTLALKQTKTFSRVWWHTHSCWTSLCFSPVMCLLFLTRFITNIALFYFPSELSCKFLRHSCSIPSPLVFRTPHAPALCYFIASLLASMCSASSFYCLLRFMGFSRPCIFIVL